MRKVDHMLVEHRVWITKNESIAVLVLCQLIQVIEFFACSSKEHRINHNILTLDVPLLAIKSLRQHKAHLLRLAKNDSRKASAITSLLLSAASSNRFD